MLFLGFFATYTRFLLSTSILIVNLSENILFFQESQDSDNDTSSKPIMASNNKPKGFTLFDFRRIYNYGNNSSNSPRFKYFGLGIAIGTLCLGGYAAHQQKLQNLIAQEQNRIALEQNREFRRQNDLEEVSQGMMTKEDYLKKYKK